METTQLMNDVDDIIVGTVRGSIPFLSQVILGDAVQPSFPINGESVVTVTIYGENLPTIGERVAVCTRGGWITESDFVKIVAAVAAMIGKLDPISDETRGQLVKMVLRHQMEHARVARQEKQVG